MNAARSLRDLPIAPELVIVAVRGDEVLEFADEAATIGAKALLVLPAGPEDDGGVAPDQEHRLLEIVRGAGSRMVGPGSLGVRNTAAEVSLNATLRGVSVHPGGLAIGSHAVGLGLGLLGHAAARRLGVSVFVSLGNRTDVSTSDLLEWCGEDERTAAVMLYVESFGDPQRFTRVAQRVARTNRSSWSKGGGRSPLALRRAPAQRRRCVAMPHSTRYCIKPGLCASIAARSCSRPPSCSRASRCHAEASSAS